MDNEIINDNNENLESRLNDIRNLFTVINNVKNKNKNLN